MMMEKKSNKNKIKKKIDDETYVPKAFRKEEILDNDKGFKPLLVFYLLAIFFSIIVRIVESFEQSLILLIIDKICCGVVIAMIINILINCFMRNWARFHN